MRMREAIPTDLHVTVSGRAHRPHRRRARPGPRRRHDRARARRHGPANSAAGLQAVRAPAMGRTVSAAHSEVTSLSHTTIYAARCLPAGSPRPS